MKKILFFNLIFLSFFISSCGTIEKHITVDGPSIDSQQPLVAATTTTSENRDNSPLCLIPVASGTVTLENALGSIDASNAMEGYVMAKYTGNNPKVKLQIVGPDSVCYTYNLSSSNYEAFPLSAGSGDYKIKIYENISDTKYSSVLAGTFTINISNIFGPNLYPNQYCNFNIDSQVVHKAMDLADNCNTDLEVVTSIYDFVSSHIDYDHEKASTVESGYISNVDDILNSQLGICLDYAAVMTSMLRSQRIPTRLEVGYAGTAYHAWISTYINDIGWVNGIIRFDGKSWSLMDPTFAASANVETLRSFIGDGSNYKSKYIY